MIELHNIEQVSFIDDLLNQSDFIEIINSIKSEFLKMYYEMNYETNCYSFHFKFINNNNSLISQYVFNKIGIELKDSYELERFPMYLTSTSYSIRNNLLYVKIYPYKDSYFILKLHTDRFYYEKSFLCDQIDDVINGLKNVLITYCGNLSKIDILTIENIEKYKMSNTYMLKVDNPLIGIIDYIFDMDRNLLMIRTGKNATIQLGSLENFDEMKNFLN